MYMLVQPQWLGDVKCDVARHVNPDSLFVQNPYAFMLGKEKEAMMSSELYTASQIAGGGGYYGQSKCSTIVVFCPPSACITLLLGKVTSPPYYLEATLPFV